MDCCQETNTRFATNVENSHAFLPKLGPNPTLAAKRGIWRLSREIQLRAMEKWCSFDPRASQSGCCRGTNTHLATSVENSHAPCLKIGNLPAKTHFGVYFVRYSFQTQVQPYRSFDLVHVWSLMWWFEGNSLWASRIPSRWPQNIVGKRKIGIPTVFAV